MITDFKGKTAVLTGAGSGFGLECARLGAKLGMNLVLVDVQQDALDKASRRNESRRRPGAVLQARRGQRRADGSHGPSRVRALRRAALRLQQRRRGRGRPDLGKQPQGLGMGDGRQRHGRGARRAHLHAHDARSRRQRPVLARPHRQHRQHGRLAEPAQHGRLQRQQARRGVLERNPVPGPGPGDRPGRRLGAVPLLCGHRHRHEPPQPPGRTRRGQTHQKPDDPAGHDRQGRGFRQGHGGRRGATGVRRHREATSSTSTATPRPSTPCRPGSKTCCRRATRPTRLPTSPKSASN
jgi:hypothetical protein